MWARLGTTLILISLSLTAGMASAQEAPSCELRQLDAELIVNLNRNYSPAEFRQLLRGFGYNVKFGDILFDRATKQEIRAFQEGYKIEVDGTANQQTQELAADLLTNLHASLNLVIKPDPLLPRNQFYGPRTEAAIRRFQKQYGFEETGIATLPVRLKIDTEAKKVLCTLYPQSLPEQQPLPEQQNQQRTNGKGGVSGLW